CFLHSRFVFFFSSRRRHTRSKRDWSSDVCSSDLNPLWYEETIVSSNPCAEYLSGVVYGGELPSSQYGGACNLGSLMLHKFVRDQIGRASCRERVEITVGTDALKQK